MAPLYIRHPFDYYSNGGCRPISFNLSNQMGLDQKENKPVSYSSLVLSESEHETKVDAADALPIRTA